MSNSNTILDFNHWIIIFWFGFSILPFTIPIIFGFWARSSFYRRCTIVCERGTWAVCGADGLVTGYVENLDDTLNVWGYFAEIF